MAEVEPEAAGGRYCEEAVLGDGQSLPQIKEAPHVFDGEPVGRPAHQMGVDFGDPVADDRQVDGFGHARDLGSRRDPARAHLVDHTISTEQASSEAERDRAPKIFAAADRGRNRGRQPRAAGLALHRLIPTPIWRARPAKPCSPGSPMRRCW